MKTYSWLKDSMLVIGLATIMTIIMTFPGYTQDTLKKNPKTTLKLKIIKDENGKKTVIDTIITSDKSIDSRVINVIIDNLDENMKGLDEGLKEWHNQPGGFDYNFDFDVPEPPEPPEAPNSPGEHRHHFDYRVEPFDVEPPAIRRGEGSLLDLLGDIPMNRIKSFNIKEKKNGTRITIEVGREPVLGFPRSSERTIIVRPGRGHAPGSLHESDRHKRVTIKSDTEDPDEL